MPVEFVKKLADKYGLGWGLNWKSVGDPMHFSAGEREGGRSLTERELQVIRKERAQRLAAKKHQEQKDFMTERLAPLLANPPSMRDGPFQPNGAPTTTPLLPNSIANSSTANMNMKTEINIMGNADAQQVQSGIEKGGRVLLRNMQPAIR